MPRAPVVQNASESGLKGEKTAYIRYDDPAGREPISLIQDPWSKEGFPAREFAVPPPGVEMGAQVLDIDHPTARTS